MSPNFHVVCLHDKLSTLEIREKQSDLHQWIYKMTLPLKLKTSWKILKNDKSICIGIGSLSVIGNQGVNPLTAKSD